ncbi:MAG: hypothetical protein GKR94_13115 [Gammaproteobacteria bacterium]|nr:hypothetical protein [Gammaproteobacteria bacterium]
MNPLLTQYLERATLLLALSVIVLPGLDFTISHDLASASTTRFLLSALLLACVEFYFRVLVPRVEDLHRAAYRTALRPLHQHGGVCTNRGAGRVDPAR